MIEICNVKITFSYFEFILLKVLFVFMTADFTNVQSPLKMAETDEVSYKIFLLRRPFTMVLRFLKLRDVFRIMSSFYHFAY